LIKSVITGQNDLRRLFEHPQKVIVEKFVDCL